MAVQLSVAYQLLHDSLRTIGDSTTELGEIEVEIRESDEELANDHASFARNMQNAEMALAENHMDGLIEALILLRVSAMNISTIFSNLADEIGKAVAVLPPYPGA